MELLDGIQTRKSIRAFKPTPIPRETIEKILKAASKSPSFTNTQPWEVAVVCGQKKEELSRILYKMAESSVPANPDIPLLKTWPAELDARAKEHGARRLQSLGVERADEHQRSKLRLMNYQFYGAPCALFLFIDSTLSSWSIYDMGLFSQSLILAAHSFGLGTCLQASTAYYPDAVREFLGIPKSKLLVLGISLGYADSKAPINAYQSNRVGLDDFVRWYA